jgi:hypothetical protein
MLKSRRQTPARENTYEGCIRIFVHLVGIIRYSQRCHCSACFTRGMLSCADAQGNGCWLSAMISCTRCTYGHDMRSSHALYPCFFQKDIASLQEMHTRGINTFFRRGLCTFLSSIAFSTLPIGLYVLFSVLQIEGFFFLVFPIFYIYIYG